MGTCYISIKDLIRSVNIISRRRNWKIWFYRLLGLIGGDSFFVKFCSRVSSWGKKGFTTKKWGQNGPIKIDPKFRDDLPNVGQDNFISYQCYKNGVVI